MSDVYSSTTRSGENVAQAARLISETGHDLRSPLTAVRESIRLVRDGDLGPINVDQQSCLSAAVDQCGCIEQMVGEMTQLERLRTGTPRVHRQWVSISEVRRLVDDTLRPWGQSRNLSVLWDGADDPNAVVFADQAMLQRLIVNLATNAMRASVEGGFVLIRTARVRRGETVRWSVVDRGRGINSAELMHVAERQVSYAGGEGLGLSISRQLAALQFSSLKIRSRSGKGTEVTFETASSGPRSVASVWTRWRIGFAVATGASTSPDTASRAWTSPSGDRLMRLDPPAVAVTLTHEASSPRSADCFAAGVVSLGGTVSRSLADQFDAEFQSQLQLFELAYRVDARRWVWGLDAAGDSAQDRIDVIADRVQSRIPGIRMNWACPQTIRLDSLRTARWMSDLLVRQSLKTGTMAPGFGADEVRLGTLPIRQSAIATARLDGELGRLRGKRLARTLAREPS